MGPCPKSPDGWRGPRVVIGSIHDMASDAAGREAQLYWLALHLTPGLGARNAYRLVQIFGHPERVFHSSRSELETAVPRLARSVTESMASGVVFEAALEEMRKVEAVGASVLPIQDPRYPQRLKEIFDPPILLYAIGQTELLQEPSIAVVGTRRPTPYGKAAAEKLTKDMVALGVTHVSGMARGVDACSHRGALAGRGGTIAVLGTGVDRPYPRENTKLYEQICSDGLVISQFPMGATAFPQNFPIRNRIISGMTLATLVVEGAQYSGSLITARLALDQGREVMAVPGPITSRPSWGPNLLIKDGAKLVQQAADIVEELSLEVRRNLKPRIAVAAAAAGAESGGSAMVEAISPTGKRVYRLLRVDAAVHIDEIIRQCEDEPSSAVLAALSELELFGAVRQLPGKNFVRTWND